MVTNIHSLKLTETVPEIGRAPKGKDCIPTIHFQVRTVSFRECNIYILLLIVLDGVSRYETTLS